MENFGEPMNSSASSRLRQTPAWRRHEQAIDVAEGPSSSVVVSRFVKFDLAQFPETPFPRKTPSTTPVSVLFVSYRDAEVRCYRRGSRNIEVATYDHEGLIRVLEGQIEVLLDRIYDEVPLGTR